MVINDGGVVVGCRGKDDRGMACGGFGWLCMMVGWWLLVAKGGGRMMGACLGIQRGWVCLTGFGGGDWNFLFIFYKYYY